MSDKYSSLLIHDISRERRDERISIVIKNNGRRVQRTDLHDEEHEATDTM